MPVGYWEKKKFHLLHSRHLRLRVEIQVIRLRLQHEHLPGHVQSLQNFLDMYSLYRTPWICISSIESQDSCLTCPSSLNIIHAFVFITGDLNAHHLSLSLPSHTASDAGRKTQVPNELVKLSLVTRPANVHLGGDG